MSKIVRCLNLDNKLLNKLLKNHLITCKDILLKVPLELVNILSISYNEAVDLVQLASKAASIQPITVHELMLKRNCKFISSGLPLFDEMLASGLPPAAITEIAGPPGCGKTQFCLSLTTSILSNDFKTSIIYIDTEGSFDPVRLLEIAQNKYPKLYSTELREESRISQDLIDDSQPMCDDGNNKNCNDYNYEKLSQLAKRVIYLREYSCDSLLKRLDDLECMIVESNAALIIIDSIASIIRREFDCSSINITHQRNKILNKIICHLKLLAENYDIPVIVVNQITTNYNSTKRKLSVSEVIKSMDAEDMEVAEEEFDGGVSIALGPTWAHAVNSRIILQFADASSFDRQMLLVKSPNAPQSRLFYKIDSSGIIISDTDKKLHLSVNINDIQIKMRSGITY